MTNSNSIRNGATRNTGVKAFAFGVAASLGFALMLGSAPQQAAGPAQIVQLERVVITGSRLVGGIQDAQLAQLPRVVIEGRRSAEGVGAGLQLADAARCSDEARQSRLC